VFLPLIKVVCVLSAISKDEKRLVLVILNKTDVANTHRLDFSLIKSPDSFVSSWKLFRTCFWKNENHTQLHEEVLMLASNVVSIQLAPLSVSTFIIDFI
jgi:hypothetical protein